MSLEDLTEDVQDRYGDLGDNKDSHVQLDQIRTVAIEEGILNGTPRTVARGILFLREELEYLTSTLRMFPITSGQNCFDKAHLTISMAATAHEEVNVLHVDDEPDFTGLTGSFLERRADRFTVETATSADEGLQLINDRLPDCVVSGYNMPGMDGLAFLQAVREEYPDLPFILFTGKGSEAVASDAIAADVTDYLQKGSGTEQYELLVNRIRNAVQARREAKRAEQESQRIRDLMGNMEELADAGAWEYDSETESLMITDGTRRLYGRDPDENLTLEAALDAVHPDDRDRLRDRFDACLETGEPYEIDVRLTTPDGGQRWLTARGERVATHESGGVIRGYIRDITEQQAYERDLKRYRTVFNELPDPVVVYDEEGRYYLVNDAAAEIRDVPREELIGTKSPYFEQIQEENPAEYDALVEGSQDTLRTDLMEEFPGRGKRTLRCNLSWVTTETGSAGAVIVTRDVTERKERMTELEEDETIIEALPDAVYVLDEEGRFTYVGDEFVELVGYDRETILGNTPSLIKDGEAVERAESQLGRVLSRDGPKTVTFEVAVQPRDGDPIVCEDHMGVLPYDGEEFDGSVGVLRDITERRQRENRFQALIEGSSEIISIVDADGRYQYQSPSFERILGHDPAETIGGTVWEDIHPDDRETVFETFEAWVESDGVSSSVEYRVRHVDGSWRWMEAHGHDQFDNPAVEGYVVNSRDITERKERQQQSELLDRVLRHNLRNDLNVIRGRAEIIRARTTNMIASSAKQIIETCDQLINHADRGREIAELLQEPPAREEFTVGPPLRNVVSSLRSDYSDATIVVKCDDEVTVQATNQLKQAIKELLTNAIVHNDSDSPEVTVSVVQTTEDVRIEIADTGPRIPELEQEVLSGNHEPTQLEHGTGLDLWLVQLIIDRLGGSVTVEQNSPTGNIVALELPVQCTGWAEH